MADETPRFWSIERWRALVPALTCVAGLFLMTLPVITLSPALPHLGLLAVLIWALFHPSLMPPYAALPVGVVADAMLGLPIGVNGTLMPLLTIAVGSIERRFGPRPYALDWLVAAGLILAYQYLTWQLLRFAVGEVPFGPLLAQTATTTLAYPFAVALIVRVQRRWGGAP